MSKARLADRMLAAREFWVDLPEFGEGRRVKLRRPAELQILQMHGGATLVDVQGAAVDWQGITEADLLGPEVGASDALAFDRAVWEVFVADSIDVFGRCAKALTEQITEHIAKLKATRGN